MSVVRINIGCGQTPTAGWTNYDNSPSVKLASRPALAGLLGRFRLLVPAQREFIAMAQQQGIRYADAVRHIPHPDRSVDVVYTSHMVEHLDRDEVTRFLREVRRVLVPGGIIRIAVPDLRFHVDRYLDKADADLFVEGVRLGRMRPKGLKQRVAGAVIGDREHHWMYDGPSMCKLLASAGFAGARVVPSGSTTIPNPGALDLAERSPESVFVEASNA